MTAPERSTALADVSFGGHVNAEAFVGIAVGELVAVAVAVAVDLGVGVGVGSAEATVKKRKQYVAPAWSVGPGALPVNPSVVPEPLAGPSTVVQPAALFVGSKYAT
jgi:hypothetical protein